MLNIAFQDHPPVQHQKLIDSNTKHRVHSTARSPHGTWKQHRKYETRTIYWPISTSNCQTNCTDTNDIEPGNGAGVGTLMKTRIARDVVHAAIPSVIILSCTCSLLEKHLLLFILQMMWCRFWWGYRDFGYTQSPRWICSEEKSDDDKMWSTAEQCRRIPVTMGPSTDTEWRFIPDPKVAFVCGLCVPSSPSHSLEK